MDLDDEQCYRALRTHDARFDGRFFVGVGTTGIYCRPICPARTPRARNCSYFPSAAAAESRGFRPCLRCRPELAPGHAVVDASRRLAQSAARLIEDGRLQDDSLAGLAVALQVTDRHLRRVFQQEFGVAPVAYAQTQRLLLAKRLLTDTQLSVTEVAMASGFASLRRFNDLFRTRYRMTPQQLRRAAPAHAPAGQLTFDLAFRPPYDWDAMLAFLALRAIPGVEQVDGRKYRRTVRLHGVRTPFPASGLATRGNGVLTSASPSPVFGFIEVCLAPGRKALRVTASASLATATQTLLARVKHLFDLACHPEAIAVALGPLAKPNPGLRLPGAIDGFEVAVRAILGQQVTVRLATTLAGRFVAAFGESIDTPYAALDRAFPAPEAIAALDPARIGELGIIGTRARAIVALAAEVAQGRLALDPSAPVDATLAALERLPGIGPWTAQYIAMRALAWPDAFPHPDVAVLKAMQIPKSARVPVLAESWRPWRAYAVLHLWKQLEKRP